jgi:hypothetical protein
MKYPEFEAFKKARFEAPPWDHPTNPIGFPPEKLKVSSDISAHLPMLEFLASQVWSVTEFGTRGCYSTSAFLSGCRGRVKSYDLHWNTDIDYLYRLQEKGKLPCEWRFEQGDTLKIKPIELTQMLFIDTLHTYDQVIGELNRHAANVTTYLVFHDTSIYSQGNVSVDRPNEAGILKAVDEFLEKNPQWQEVYRVEYNHGLLVLEKF